MKSESTRQNDNSGQLHKRSAAVALALAAVAVVYIAAYTAESMPADPPHRTTLGELRELALRLGKTPPETLPWTNEHGADIFKERQAAWLQDPERYTSWALGQIEQSNSLTTIPALAGDID